MSLKEIGERLRRRREELGLSLRDAQTATKIRQRYLEALEEGDDSVMPGYVYAKGFLRAYASYLGLDGWALVEEYKAIREGAAPSGSEAPAGGSAEPQAGTDPAARAARPQGAAGSARPSPLRSPAHPPEGRGQSFPASTPLPLPPVTPARPRSAGRVGLVLMLLFLLLASAAAGVYYLYLVTQPPLDEAGQGTPAGTPAEAEPGEAAGDDEGQAEPGQGTEADAGRPGDAGSEPGPSGEGEPGQQGQQEDTNTEEPPAVSVSQEGSTVRYTVAADAVQVQARVSQRCWVRVEVDGTVVYEGTLEPGASVVWEAGRELRVRAGNPPGLELTVNGRPMGPLQAMNPLTLIFQPGG